MIARFNYIDKFARDRFAAAKLATDGIPWAMLAAKERHTKNVRAEAEDSFQMSLIGNEPEYAELETSFGMAAWAAILSVDMRGSSSRAVRVGAEHTYLSMHTFLPTMVELVAQAKGKIVGLRGDGLFGAFGITELTGTGKEVTSESGGKAVQDATRCGKAMLESVEEIVNQILDEDGIDGDIQIGVGIDAGPLVITRIGFRDANEVTAYGPPVDRACKMCAKTHDILLTPYAQEIFPSGKGGRVSFSQTGDGFRPHYPADMKMLDRTEPRNRKAR